MQFTTPITIAKRQNFSYNSNFLLMGSCFAENIGNKLKESLFQGFINPFGILYNPLSIAKAMERLMDLKPFTIDELVIHNGLYHSMMHHGRFSNADSDVILKQINEEYNRCATSLTQLSHLFITFGSSWVYELNGNVVANCHKLPQNQFIQRRLRIEEVVSCWTELLYHLRTINPQLEVVLTVSPVRYFEHGPLATHTNKAVLLLAVEELCANIPNTNYFPAYELIMDELRDYRYYDDSLTHPSRLAVDYVWERFTETYLTKVSRTLMLEAQKLTKRLSHHLIHCDDTECQRFVATTQEAIATFIKHLNQQQINPLFIESINTLLYNKLQQFK